ncbi:hypothetical protein HYT57_04350 [Candidatus Woesearchaeota archaeon]|nr:hypothetical protein [Candidatus Woesearchaeota archaeon]
MTKQRCKITFLGAYNKDKYVGDMHFAALGSSGSRYYVDRVNGLILPVEISLRRFSINPHFRNVYATKQEAGEEGAVKLNYHVDLSNGTVRILKTFLGAIKRDGELEREVRKRNILENGQINRAIGLGISQETIDLSFASGYTLIEKVVEVLLERLNRFEPAGYMPGDLVTTGRRRGGPSNTAI